MFQIYPELLIPKWPNFEPIHEREVYKKVQKQHTQPETESKIAETS